MEDNTTKFKVEFGEIHEIEVGSDWYEGPYTITPSQESQTIQIAKLTAKQNIEIEPIPSNYGKVTQIGNALVIE